MQLNPQKILFYEKCINSQIRGKHKFIEVGIVSGGRKQEGNPSSNRQITQKIQNSLRLTYET